MIAIFLFLCGDAGVTVGQVGLVVQQDQIVVLSALSSQVLLSNSVLYDASCRTLSAGLERVVFQLNETSVSSGG